MLVREELRALGLEPRTWDEAVAAAKEKLPQADRAAFLRHHRNFVEYVSEDTLNRFYGFVFSRGISHEINSFRFQRLESVLSALLPILPPGLSVLDVGAGSGIPGAVLLKHGHLKRYVAQDPCREVRDYLQSMGFAVLPHPVPRVPPGGAFDRILCLDSLGELNSDDQGALAEPDLPLEDRVRLVEQLYGFGQKLEPWKPYLAEGGRVLVWEPIKHLGAWEAIGTHLNAYGWNPRFHGTAPSNSYLELTLG